MSRASKSVKMISAKQAKKNVKSFKEGQVKEFELEPVLSSISAAIRSNSRNGLSNVKLDLIEDLGLNSSQAGNTLLVNALIEKIKEYEFSIYQRGSSLTITW